MRGRRLAGVAASVGLHAVAAALVLALATGDPRLAALFVDLVAPAERAPARPPAVARARAAIPPAAAGDPGGPGPPVAAPGGARGEGAPLGPEARDAPAAPAPVAGPPAAPGGASAGPAGSPATPAPGPRVAPVAPAPPVESPGAIPVVVSPPEAPAVDGPRVTPIAGAAAAGPGSVPGVAAAPAGDGARRASGAGGSHVGLAAGVGSGAPGPRGAPAVAGGGTGLVPAGDPAGQYRAFLEDVRGRIQRALRYPESARRRGLEGVVVLELEILPSGRLARTRVVASSSHAVLDDAALDSVRDVAAAEFPPGLAPRRIRVELPVTFRLE